MAHHTYTHAQPRPRRRSFSFSLQFPLQLPSRLLGTPITLPLILTLLTLTVVFILSFQFLLPLPIYRPLGSPSFGSLDLVGEMVGGENGGDGGEMGEMGEIFRENHLIFKSVKGFFLQDGGDEGVGGGEGWDYTKNNLGLISRSYSTDRIFDPNGERTQWERFKFWIGWVNGEEEEEGKGRNEGDGERKDGEKKGGKDDRFKVLFLGRHGEGVHNVAEAFYGTEAWDCYWSLQTGNGTISWDDAALTPTGMKQALIAHDFWASHLQAQKIPAPQSYYVSPLSRCLETARLTFSGLDLPADRPFAPVVKERFRESIGAHTCDRRSSRSSIRERYPTYRVEEGFAEMDPWWVPDRQETGDAEDQRVGVVLDDVFRRDDQIFISVTTHSGTIAAILRVLGHRKFSLGTGAVIPVLVKVETVDGPAPTSPAAPYRTVSTCAAPPPTSTIKT